MKVDKVLKEVHQRLFQGAKAMAKTPKRKTFPTVLVEVEIGINPIAEAMRSIVADEIHGSIAPYDCSDVERFKRVALTSLAEMSRDSVLQEVRRDIRRSHLNDSTAQELLEDYSNIDWYKFDLDQYVLPRLRQLFPEFEVKSDV